MRAAATIGAAAMFGLLGAAGCAGPSAAGRGSAESPGAGAFEGGSSLVGRTERGRATYYADRFAGRPTASGEPYDPRDMTAAHRKLPFGTVVEVTRTDGRRVVVRINDRGPFGDDARIIDLSRRAAEAIGMLRDGVAAVTLRVLAAAPTRAKTRR